MSRANTIQTNFTAGEISPNMYGRVDVAKYFNGVRKLRNLIPLPQGGVRRRPGTGYLGAVNDRTKKVRLRTFKFSSTDSYILEFQDFTLRIWKSGVLIGAPLVVTTPYGENDISQLRLTQSADIIFLAHSSYPPQTLTRNSNTSWTLAPYANDDGPYMAVTPPNVTIIAAYPLDTSAAVSTVATFATTGGSKNVTALARSPLYAAAYHPMLTITGHGLGVGLAGVRLLLAGFTPSNTTPNNPGMAALNGVWNVYVADANTVYLINVPWYDQTVYTVAATTSIQYAGGYVEFLQDDVWKLARVVSFSSPTTAVVDVVDEIVNPDASNHVKGTGFSVNIYADSPLFATADIGTFVRCLSTALGFSQWDGWYYIYAITDSLHAVGYLVAVDNFNDTSKTVQITNRAVTTQLTASAATFVASDATGNRKIRLKYGAEWQVGYISAYVSSTVVFGIFTADFPVGSVGRSSLYNNGLTEIWKFGAWSPATGYPTVVGFHQNRLCWFSSVAEPTTKWFTKSGDYYSFEPSTPDNSFVADDNAMTMTLISRQVNKGRWLDSGPVLLSGTEGAEWQIKPSSIQQTLTPTNFSATVQTAYGAADLDCLRIGLQTLFVERSALKVRELTYEFTVDSFISKDISIISEHILREHGGITDWCAQQNPYSILWLVLADGRVATITYEREHDVVAFALHDLGGTVESVTAATAVSGEDVIYFAVTRTVNAVVQKYIESLTGLMSDTAPYVDCYKTNSFGNVGIGYLTGITHLIGQSVKVVLDGVFLGAQTVDGSGQVQIGYVGNLAYAGLPMEATLSLLDPEGGSQAGSSQGKKKRITESAARVYKSWYFKVASATGFTNDTENLTASRDPETTDRFAIAPALTLAVQATPGGTVGTFIPTSLYSAVSGDVIFSTDDAFDNGGRIEIVQDDPYPLNVTCVMHKLNTNE